MPIQSTRAVSFMTPSAKPIQLGNTILVAMGKVIATTSWSQVKPSERAARLVVVGTAVTPLLTISVQNAAA